MKRKQVGNRIRIVGGQWRGRRLTLPRGTDVRPTPDRVRETLFNWLQPHIVGANCVDLFAGSGVLGLEALSRGANAACFVERDHRLVAAIEAHAKEFGGFDRVSTYLGSSEAWLSSPTQSKVDICFVDPPYDVPLAPVIPELVPILAPQSLVYVERPDANAMDELTEHGEFHRLSKAAGVHFGLLAPHPLSR